MNRILVVDDSDEDFDVLLDCIHRLNLKWNVDRCKRGDDVIPFLAALLDKDHPVQLILLDLNLIGLNGIEVLRYLKASKQFAKIPVLIFSTSSSQKDVELCYSLGANSYSCKPVDLEKFEGFVESIAQFWGAHVTFSPASQAQPRQHILP